MTTNEIKALISLLDDPEIAPQIQGEIQNLGEAIIPFLEESWEETLDPQQQQRLEDLIHQLQFEGVQQRLRVWRDSGGHDLLEGMWLLNSYQYPDADLQALNRAIEQLRFEAWTLLRPEMHPADQVQILNHVIFRNHKFSANTQHFHSPANSMLHRVLETKRGNPLSLGVIYLLVAQRLNLPVFGVNLPNLFVLTYQLFKDEHDKPVLPFYINCYNRGLYCQNQISSTTWASSASPRRSRFTSLALISISCAVACATCRLASRNCRSRPRQPRCRSCWPFYLSRTSWAPIPTKISTKALRHRSFR
ncbi:transglutaminase-like domain-containing protein [Hymenobacter sp. BRD67]|uniref:transglutaminase-like domain-containing protein n=1 Tax=Hymenobacter sp. BRD67 TaxID=2675877 RepID=UPI00293BB399|nr:transglutaminase-like domain-containing protein [Hymenobacter sp. BRD67]